MRLIRVHSARNSLEVKGIWRGGVVQFPQKILAVKEKLAGGSTRWFPSPFFVFAQMAQIPSRTIAIRSGGATLDRISDGDTFSTADSTRSRELPNGPQRVKGDLMSEKRVMPLSSKKAKARFQIVTLLAIWISCSFDCGFCGRQHH